MSSSSWIENGEACENWVIYVSKYLLLFLFALYSYDIVLDGLSFQDVEELIEEVQEARRIKLLHQPSKVRPLFL